MKMRKMNNSRYLLLSAWTLFIGFGASPVALAEESPVAQPEFLQEIQSQLTAASGLNDYIITIKVTPETKRVMEITPDQLILSYGFLQHMETIEQLTATLAHMTAHIALDDVDTPPLPEDAHNADNDRSLKDYATSAVRPRYPDKQAPPVGDAGYHNDDPKIIERPKFQNKDYDFAVNKAAVVDAEQELAADKVGATILERAGYCPSDTARLLQYFYEHPQKLLGNKHFPLDVDGWQRVDAAERLHSAHASCSAAQQNKTAQYSAAFAQWKSDILKQLK